MKRKLTPTEEDDSPPEKKQKTTSSSEFFKAQEPHPIQLVLDIDDTLAKGFFPEVLKNYPQAKWFKDNNLILKAILPHILHPGVIEFIQYIFDIPNARICFFSSGEEQRNQLFVEKLLKKCLPKRHEELLKSISVFSKQDLTSGGGFRNFYGNSKKDLKTCLKPEEKLETTLLIEDDPSYAMIEQAKNLLFTKCHSYFDGMVDSFPEYFYAANHIFAITGLLNALLKQDRSKLASNLHEIHPQTPEDLIYHPNPQYFIDGLEVLKKYNKNLNFYCHDPKAIEKFILSEIVTPRPSTCAI